jgi:hypothetical protein
MREGQYSPDSGELNAQPKQDYGKKGSRLGRLARKTALIVGGATGLIGGSFEAANIVEKIHVAENSVGSMDQFQQKVDKFRDTSLRGYLADAQFAMRRADATESNKKFAGASIRELNKAWKDFYEAIRNDGSLTGAEMKAAHAILEADFTQSINESLTPEEIQRLEQETGATIVSPYGTLR